MENEKNELTCEQKEALNEMFNLLSKNTDSNFVSDFFDCLFTPPELRDFATRWLLVKEIDKGTTQREIAQKYHISLCKITRGSKELKKPDSAFRKILDISKKQNSEKNNE